MSEATPKQFVAVLDFGAQYGQLIARRVRDLHVYSEIVPCDIPADELAAIMVYGCVGLASGPGMPDEAALAAARRYLRALVAEFRAGGSPS